MTRTFAAAICSARRLAEAGRPHLPHRIRDIARGS
jgi:hypothetical protein